MAPQCPQAIQTHQPSAPSPLRTQSFPKSSKAPRRPQISRPQIPKVSQSPLGPPISPRPPPGLRPPSPSAALQETPSALPSPGMSNWGAQGVNPIGQWLTLLSVVSPGLACGVPPLGQVTTRHSHVVSDVAVCTLLPTGPGGGWEEVCHRVRSRLPPWAPHSGTKGCTQGGPQS